MVLIRKMIMKFLFLLLISLCHAKENWIDPHEIILSKTSYNENNQDLNTNSNNKNVINDEVNLNNNFNMGDNKNQDSNSVKNINMINNEANYNEKTIEIYLKRIVNMIVVSANPEKTDDSLYTGMFQFRKNSEDYNFLIDFGNKGSLTLDDIKRLDTVLSEIFSMYNSHYFNFTISTENILSYEVLVVLITILLFFTFYCLSKNSNGFLFILFYLISILMIVDFGIRYKLLLEEAKEHNQNVKYSEECDDSKMKWKDYIKFLFVKRNCETKIVTPLDVFLNQLKNIIIIPLQAFGIGLGSFSGELWEKLPYFWKALMFPVILGFLVVGILVCFSPRFKLCILHLITLEFGDKSSNEDKISGKRLDKLLEATRPLIQPVTLSPEKKKEKNKRKKSPKQIKYIENNKNKNKHKEPVENKTEIKNKQGETISMEEKDKCTSEEKKIS